MGTPLDILQLDKQTSAASVVLSYVSVAEEVDEVKGCSDVTDFI